MKHCPTCLAQYDDSWSVCLKDDTKLLDGPGRDAEEKVLQGASRWRRFGTMIVDDICICLIIIIFFFPVMWLTISGKLPPRTMAVAYTLVYPLYYGVMLLYYSVCEGFFKTTPGKYMFGTRIIKVGPGSSLDKAPITFFQALVRSLCRFIPFEPFSFFRDSRLGWHDTVARTAVVEDRAGGRPSFFERLLIVGITILTPPLLFGLFLQELSVSTAASRALWVEGRLRVVSAPEITDSERVSIRDAVRNLGLELAKLPRREPWRPWIASKERVAVQSLINVLNGFTKDNILSRSEYTDWMKWYEMRESLDSADLTKYTKTPYPVPKDEDRTH